MASKTQAGFGEVAEVLRRSTVQVSSGRGFGSGVILGADGLIATNAHVVGSTQARVKLWDGRMLEAVVSTRDRARDLAMLRVSGSELPAATLADSSNVRVGELVFAIGSPMGFAGALSTGVIHATGMVRGLGPSSWLQADVQLAPGNSGGPLADAQGRVVGINTMVASGLALAVPSNAVANFLAYGTEDVALGVELRPVRMLLEIKNRKESRIGLLILKVFPGSAASVASLMIGDVVLGANETLFRSVNDLEIALQGRGERVLQLLFVRGDRRKIRKVAVRLGAAVRAAA
jgi:serine protease Do